MTDGEEIIRLLSGQKLSYAINAGLIEPREETGRSTADASLDVYMSMLKLQSEIKGFDLEAECDPESLPDPGSEHSTEAKGVRCGAGRSGFAVNWRGEMHPCNSFPSEPVDVLLLGFAESWKRVNQIALNYPLPAECEGCAYSAVCKHCVAEHAAGAPAGHASPAICAWGRRMVAEGLRTLKQPVE